MRILAVSDVEAKYYYDYYRPGRLDEFDLILSCGDLRKNYLEFLATLSHCPLLYVRGNHDERFAQDPPGGCICVEDQIYVHGGIRILGLGGSYRYRDGANLYTERQMAARVRRLRYQLWKHKGFDILLTHAPARHINDFDSLSHRGLECFGELLEKYAPKYFVHGHIHTNYGTKVPQWTERGPTTIVNACDHYVFDY